jgi:hypothetical protein
VAIDVPLALEAGFGFTVIGVLFQLARAGV